MTLWSSQFLDDHAFIGQLITDLGMGFVFCYILLKMKSKKDLVKCIGCMCVRGYSGFGAVPQLKFNHVDLLLLQHLKTAFNYKFACVRRRESWPKCLAPLVTFICICNF